MSTTVIGTDQIYEMTYRQLRAACKSGGIKYSRLDKMRMRWELVMLDRRATGVAAGGKDFRNSDLQKY